MLGKIRHFGCFTCPILGQEWPLTVIPGHMRFANAFPFRISY